MILGPVFSDLGKKVQNVQNAQLTHKSSLSIESPKQIDMSYRVAVRRGF